MTLLFSPLDLRDVRLRNRVVISPMAQYCAEAGCATDFHLAHLASFATGGAALVFTESTKVEPRGVGSYGDLCLWSDAHAQSLKRITRFVKEAGAVPGIQLNHSGRKARSQRPWEGFGPIQAPDGELWTAIAPSAVPAGPGWPVPLEMSTGDIDGVIAAWAASARLALASGFEVLEIHGAHGYLVHQFLSPAANRRTDGYGGSLPRRMRFALELTDAIRAVWPAQLPLFFRLSATDDMGWSLEDSVALAKALRARGVDVIDCSSGGMSSRSPTASQARRPLGYQVPYAERIRKEAGVRSMAVGLIVDPAQAEQILQDRRADLIAIGREALLDPYWALHAAAALGEDPWFSRWPRQHAWWLERRARAGIVEDAPDTRAQAGTAAAFSQVL